MSEPTEFRKIEDLVSQAYRRRAYWMKRLGEWYAVKDWPKRTDIPKLKQENHYTRPKIGNADKRSN